MTTPRNDKRRPSRDGRVTVRFTPAELQVVHDLAGRSGITVAAAVRAVVLDEASGVPTGAGLTLGTSPDPREPVDVAELKKLRVEVNRIGVNVNQLARLANRQGAVVCDDSDDASTVTSALKDAVTVLRQVQVALGGTRLA